MKLNGKNVLVYLQGKRGATGAKLVSVAYQGKDDFGNNVYLQTFDDGTTAELKAPKGEDGKSIAYLDTDISETIGESVEITLSESVVYGTDNLIVSANGYLGVVTEFIVKVYPPVLGVSAGYSEYVYTIKTVLKLTGEDGMTGHLVFGGVARCMNYDINYLQVSLTTEAQEKLGITDDLISIYPDTESLDYEGLYFIVDAGRTSTITFNDITLTIGDWLVATAGGWEKIENTPAVHSVAGKTGAVVLDTSDISGLNAKLANIETKANSTDVYTKTEVDSKVAEVAEKVDDKLDAKPNGADSLISENDKINLKYIPDSILGQLIYGGTFGFDGTNTVAYLTSNAQEKLGITSGSFVLSPSTYSQYQGLYFVAEASINEKTFANLYFNTGDWLIAHASGWSKVDNTDAVYSVNGKTGKVVLATSDISGLNAKLDEIEENIDSKLDKITDTADLERVYIISADGNNSTRSVDINNTASTVVKRNASGQIAVSDPTSNLHAVNKQHLDTQLNKKLDIINNSSTDNKVYTAKASGGGATLTKIAINPDNYSLAQRDANGKLKGATATEDNDLTTLKQVNEGLAKKIDFNKYGGTATINAFATEAGSLGLSFNSNNEAYSNRYYIVKYDTQVDVFRVQHTPDGGTTWIEPFVIRSDNSVRINEERSVDHTKLTLVTELFDTTNAGSIRYDSVGDMCILTFYCHVVGLTTSWNSYKVADLPSGVTAVQETYGSVQTNGAATPHPNQGILVKVTGSEVHIMTQGANTTMEDAWIMGQLFFIKAH